MTHRIWPEDQFTAHLVNLLRQHGDVAIQYLTARARGVSSRGDLIFVPFTGPHKGVSHVVEIKATSLEYMPEHIFWRSVETLLQLKEVNQFPIRFAFLTTALVAENLVVRARERGVEVINNAASPEAGAQQILAWADVAGRFGHPTDR